MRQIKNPAYVTIFLWGYDTGIQVLNVTAINIERVTGHHEMVICRDDDGSILAEFKLDQVQGWIFRKAEEFEVQ